MQVIQFTGSGETPAEIQPIDIQDPAINGPNTSTSSRGDMSDCAAVVAGSIALLQRGVCPFGAKVANAVEASAEVVIILNEGKRGRTGPDPCALGEEVGVSVPVLATSYGVGLELL